MYLQTEVEPSRSDNGGEHDRNRCKVTHLCKSFQTLLQKRIEDVSIHVEQHRPRRIDGKYKYDIMPLSTYLDVITLVHPLALGSQGVIKQHLRVAEFLRKQKSPLCRLNSIRGVERPNVEVVIYL